MWKKERGVQNDSQFSELGNRMGGDSKAGALEEETSFVRKVVSPDWTC